MEALAEAVLVEADSVAVLVTAASVAVSVLEDLVDLEDLFSEDLPVVY